MRSNSENDSTIWRVGGPCAARILLGFLWCAPLLAGCTSIRSDTDFQEVDEVDAVASAVGVAVARDAATASRRTPLQLTRRSVDGPIGRGDNIQVHVYDEPELSGVYTILPSGSIAFPLLGDVPLMGLTTADAGRLLHGMLGDGFLADPLVNVHRLSEMATGFHVLGAVKQPGSYDARDVIGRMTLSDLLFAAGGLDANASRTGVMLIRQSAEGPAAYPIHPSVLVSPERGNVVVGLEPGDIVTVPWQPSVSEQGALHE